MNPFMASKMPARSLASTPGMCGSQNTRPAAKSMT